MLLPSDFINIFAPLISFTAKHISITGLKYFLNNHKIVHPKQRRTQQVVQVGLGLPRFWPNKLTDQLEVQPTSPFGRIPTPLPDGPSNHSSFTHASTAPGSRATRRPNARRECATGEQDFCICSRYSSSPPCHAARSRRHEPMTLERQAAVKLARAVSLVHLFPASECKLQA